MDPPIAATASSSYEPEAEGSASLTSCIDHLLLLDDLETGDGGTFPSLEAASMGLSIPAHNALMAFFAAMEALEEEQQSNDAVPQTGSCETAHIVAKPAPTACSTGPSEKKKRIRAKQEIDILRENAEALQHQLELLQSAATQRGKQSPESGGNTTAPLLTNANFASKFKKPKLQHNGVVEQNRQLRKLAKSQQQFAKQIESMLMSKCEEKEIRRALGVYHSLVKRSILISDTVTMKTPLSKADLVVFYEALTDKLDTLYAQLGDVFADADLHTSHKEFSDVKFVIDKKHVTLQLRDMKTLPFSFESVKDVSSRLLRVQCVKEGDGVDELLVVDEGVMMIRRGMVVQLEEGRSEVEIPTRAVAKKFLSKDRMVFCWDGTIDWPTPPQTAKDQPESVPLREKGWAVIKPVPGVPGLCTMQMCLLVTPGFSDEQLVAMISRKDMEEGITKFVIPTYQQAFVSRYQMIENTLVDEQRR